jgi:hypothetical protein
MRVKDSGLCIEDLAVEAPSAKTTAINRGAISNSILSKDRQSMLGSRQPYIALLLS